MIRFNWVALTALAVGGMLTFVEPSFAQRRGGGSGRGYGGYGGYNHGGYSGYNHGGWGGYYGGYYPGYYGSWGGYRYSPWYGSGYYSNGYYAPSYYSDSYSPSYYSAPPIADSGSQSFYPPNTDSRGYIHVRVPPNATVYFDNTPTSQTGPDRVFVTPALDASKSYSYEISVRWMENGQERRLTRTVQPMPGQTIDVNFMNTGQ